MSSRTLQLNVLCIGLVFMLATSAIAGSQLFKLGVKPFSVFNYYFMWETDAPLTLDTVQSDEVVEGTEEYPCDSKRFCYQLYQSRRFLTFEGGTLKIPFVYVIIYPDDDRYGPVAVAVVQVEGTEVPVPEGIPLVHTFVSGRRNFPKFVVFFDTDVRKLERSDGLQLYTGGIYRDLYVFYPPLSGIMTRAQGTHITGPMENVTLTLELVQQVPETTNSYSFEFDPELPLQSTYKIAFWNWKPLKPKTSTTSPPSEPTPSSSSSNAILTTSTAQPDEGCGGISLKPANVWMATSFCILTLYFNQLW